MVKQGFDGNEIMGWSVTLSLSWDNGKITEPKTIIWLDQTFHIWERTTNKNAVKSGLTKSWSCSKVYLGEKLNYLKSRGSTQHLIKTFGKG